MRLLSLIFVVFCSLSLAQSNLKINKQEYFETQGLNVMVFHDYYPDGHQTGVTIIQNGNRIAANGDLRLEAAPGQWSPVPVVGKRIVNLVENEISVSLSYPDSSKDRKGFNPIVYPDLTLKYNVRVKCVDTTIKIFVDLEKPLDKEWIGKVGFNIELFPGEYFGKSYIMDNKQGIFPQQVNGPSYYDTEHKLQITPLAEGKNLIVAPENENNKLVFQSNNNLILLDGRGEHNNGWFIVRSLVLPNKTKDAVELTITPSIKPNYIYSPVVQVSQVGYHPNQSKIAVIEQDKYDTSVQTIKLYKFSSIGNKELITSDTPKLWGGFIRYKYYQFDFSKVNDEGIYLIEYGKYTTSPFQISKEVFARHVWQPTLEYFLPVQMCHMRVNDRYKVWHGLCHEDDALMAPTDTIHFDGYEQGKSTLTKYKSGEHVPNLNVGGWHDAGDYDLRIESQAATVYSLALAYEEFNVTYDETTINQNSKLVEMHQPDGTPDILQQIEHGLISIVNGYNSLGRLYRGIICPTLRQYTLLGDGINMTDGKIFSDSNKDIEDDRLVFTEENPWRELYVAGTLAGTARAIKNYNPQLSSECIKIAKTIWGNYNSEKYFKSFVAIELFLTTGEAEYKNYILNYISTEKQIINNAWLLGRALPLLKDENYNSLVNSVLGKLKTEIENQQNENPYGVPYKPDIWGAGWSIQEFGVKQYFLNKSFPNLFPKDNLLKALNFVLGTHPGNNTSSFASGVGVNSLIVAYGVNRDEWSYIPGGVGSGTAIIRPDFPELKVWPYFWQQAEYVMGGGACDFMFLVLAANSILNN